MTRHRQQGYLLIAVVTTLFLLATVAVLLTHSSSIEANTSSAEMEADRADYVAQAAMQHALWRTENNACMGDVTIPETALGPDSYDATITGAAAGTAYVMHADQDAWIRSDDPSRNNGTSASNHIRQETGKVEQVLTRFDLAAIPANSQILSAVALFHVKDGKEHPEGIVSLHEVAADWTETSVTWESFAGAYRSAAVGTIPAQDTGNVWVSINLTGLVQAWVNGQPNYGVLMQSLAEGVHAEYTAREDSTNPPRLQVVVGSGAPSPVTISATGTLDNGVKRKLKDRLAIAYQPSTIAALSSDGVSIDDAWFTSGQTDWNYGAHSHLRVQSGAERTLIRFNPHQRIPAGARVTSATLQLHTNRVDAAGQVEAYSVNREWAEGTCQGNCAPNDGVTWTTYDGTNSWTSPGGDAEAGPLATATATVVGEWVSWDITTAVNSWVAGTSANHGLLLVGNSADVQFVSSDNVDLSLRPRITLKYACECGTPCMAPNGAGSIALIGDDPSPDPDDQLKMQIIESWGYKVDFYEDQDSDSVNWSNYDLAYVSETSRSGDVTANLTDLAIGVVNEEPNLYDDLQLASGSSEHVGSSIDITDNSHYITSIYPQGSKSIYTGDMEILTANSPLAGGLQTLGEFASKASLTALDVGAPTTSGTAAGRRVTLPLGQHVAAGFDWTHLNDNGHLLVQRSIEWAMGPAIYSNGMKLLLVVVNPGSLTAQEDAKKSLIESWGFAVTLIDESADPAKFDTAFGEHDVVFVTEDVTASNVGTKLNNASIGVVTEEANLSDELGFSSTIDWASGTDFKIDNSHYITTPLPESSTLLTTSESLAYLSGVISSEIGLLGAHQGGAGIAVLEPGALLVSGGNAPARRVFLPWGGNNMDVAHLTADGLTIFKRSLEWGAGVDVAESSSMIISTMGGATLGGLTFTDKDLVEYFADTDTAALYLEGAAVGLTQDVDAVHVLPSGHIVLSTVGSGSLGGQAYDNEDLVSYDPATDTGTLFFDGSALFTSGSTDVSAVHVLSNGNLLMTNEYAATLGGLAFEPSDIIEYDPGLGTASMFLDGSGVGLSAWIDAVHLLDNGHIVLSTATAATLGGLSFSEGDLVQYDPGADSATLYFDGALFTDAEHIRSVYISGGNPPVLGPIAHWKLDDGTGFTAIDSAGGNHGTLAGDPTWTVGAIGDALDFDGSGDTVVTDNAFTPPPVGTVTFWMQVSGPPASHGRILGLDDTWEIRHVTTGTPDGIPYGLVFDLGVTGVNTEFVTMTTLDSPGRWYHVAATYDTNTDAYVVYLDGAAHKSGTYPSTLSVPAAGLLTLGTRTGSSNYYDGMLDDVRVYDRMLSAAEVADLYSAGPGSGGGGGGSPGYVEKFNLFTVANSDIWQPVDLSVPGVPANAVAEIAITNSRTGSERWGGVRARGSNLDRRFRLHEAEGGGVDAVVMHVQTDANGHIEAYSDNTSEVTFRLLGYWTGATYVELFDRFTAGGSGSWRSHNFGNEGVGANQVAEVVIVNTSTSSERLAGVRPSGTSMVRRFNIHEAESGGVDTVSMMVNTDASANAEVYTSSDSDIDFYVVGYWSTPPGTYTEKGGSHSQMTSAATWQQWNLAGFGVPANAVVQVVVTNDGDTAEQEMGVRGTGSSRNRLLDLQEAESGGSDNAAMHAVADSSSSIEAYSESGPNDRYFYPVGWWVLN